MSGMDYVLRNRRGDLDQSCNLRELSALFLSQVGTLDIYV